MKHELYEELFTTYQLLLFLNHYLNIWSLDGKLKHNMRLLGMKTHIAIILKVYFCQEFPAPETLARSFWQ